MPKDLLWIKSAVNERYQYSEELWIISVVNTGSKIRGHAVLVIEGSLGSSSSPGEGLFLSPVRFRGDYDIRAILDPDQDQDSSINPKGRITEIRCFENLPTPRDYKGCSLKSYPVEASLAKGVITSIKQDAEKVARGEILLYQHLGKHHWLVRILGTSDAGDNCAGWCLEKLAIAGVGDGCGKPKPKKVAKSCIML